MEKNKTNITEDSFLKNYLQEITLDKTKPDFTANVMDAILKEEQKVVMKTTPLISKKIWFLAASFVAICLLFIVKGKGEYKFPKVNFSFLNDFQMPNLFDSLSISNTMFYAIVIFSIMFFAQVFYLKNYYNKRLN